MKARRNITAMRVEEIDALLGGEAQRLSDKYREVPLDFMDGYGWAVTQICRLFRDAVPVIKCMDCKHYDGYYCHNKWWGDGGGNYTPPIKSEDGFCDWAERKEENGK